MDFEIDEEQFEQDVKIKVIGVGGGGGNAVENMVRKGVEGVDFIVVNTDVSALRSKDGTTMERVQIGRKTTKGRGAGGKPPVGAKSAEEDKEQVEQAIKGASMVFIAAGMGGGTGTGAAPVIAQVAKEMGILTVGVVTKPFDFEMQFKMNTALQGIAELRKNVDALVIVPNQRLLSIKEKNITMKAAYAMVDDVLYKAVCGISDLVNCDGVINIDFEDVRSTLENSGDAHMAIGKGSVEDAVQQIVESPLLETSIKSAEKLLVNLRISEDTPLDDVQRAMTLLTSAASPNVEVIHGVAYSSDLHDEMEITVIATCFALPVNDYSTVDANPDIADGQILGGLANPAFPTSSMSSSDVYGEKDSFSDIESIFSFKDR